MPSRSVDPVPLPPAPSAGTQTAGSSRHALNRAEGTLSFDLLASAPTRRLSVLWLENRLDCGLWSYYCELRNAMAELHELCTPSPSRTCLGEGFAPDVAVVGPRFSINIPMPNETLGFARSRLNRLPLLIIVRRPSRTAASAAASAPLVPHASRLAQHASRSTPRAGPQSTALAHAHRTLPPRPHRPRTAPAPPACQPRTPPPPGPRGRRRRRRTRRG